MGLRCIRTGFPDPFAVATIGGEQTRTTGVIKKTLNPYWNESFDMYVPLYHFMCAYGKILI
jgi:Ca2+-dependent lipid-binding protein